MSGTTRNRTPSPPGGKKGSTKQTVQAHTVLASIVLANKWPELGADILRWSPDTCKVVEATEQHHSQKVTVLRVEIGQSVYPLKQYTPDGVKSMKLSNKYLNIEEVNNRLVSRKGIAIRHWQLNAEGTEAYKCITYRELGSLSQAEAIQDFKTVMKLCLEIDKEREWLLQQRILIGNECLEGMNALAKFLPTPERMGKTPARCEEAKTEFEQAVTKTRDELAGLGPPQHNGERYVEEEENCDELERIVSHPYQVMTLNRLEKSREIIALSAYVSQRALLNARREKSKSVKQRIVEVQKLFSK